MKLTDLDKVNELYKKRKELADVCHQVKTFPNTFQIRLDGERYIKQDVVDILRTEFLRQIEMQHKDVDRELIMLGVDVKS